ncbi:zinc-binding dehydrogenase [Sphaerisporangium perillae]|uniref:zinc-binding dehydrogenase n=1 Tax=Sphaerisporangium perillae TaxID=2935860 RepID=UPI0020100A3E|nr:zinc-binding dehydrogenase [Sphaerisporangium perillae]
MNVRAIVVDPGAPASLRIGEVPEPEPEAGQAVVEVRHASVNFGEVRYAGHQPPGTVLGYDAAGVVVRAAADGSGPARGSRVVAFGPGAWSQRAAFATGDLAEVPESVALADAASLPLAGITALRTLRAAGSVLGRRVLITGASGGVGRTAVQLARRAGAYVIASVGSPARGEGLAALGADEVVIGLDSITDPVDVVLENVGGSHLVRAWELLKPGGNLQSIGWASGEPAVFPPNSIFTLGAAKSLNSFGDATRVGPDLVTLIRLVERGELSPEVGWRGPWGRVAEAVEALFGRRVPGKIVLDVPPLEEA